MKILKRIFRSFLVLTAVLFGVYITILCVSQPQRETKINEPLVKADTNDKNVKYIRVKGDYIKITNKNAGVKATEKVDDAFTQTNDVYDTFLDDKKNTYEFFNSSDTLVRYQQYDAFKEFANAMVDPPITKDRAKALADSFLADFAVDLSGYSFIEVAEYTERNLYNVIYGKPIGGCVTIDCAEVSIRKDGFLREFSQTVKGVYDGKQAPNIDESKLKAGLEKKIKQEFGEGLVKFEIRNKSDKRLSVDIMGNWSLAVTAYVQTKMDGSFGGLPRNYNFHTRENKWVYE
ncbi:MAG: hypothetical protein BGN88_05385 [Clostridiales bacterium 43-6]|nr:MAG: hypothetical protein BGN88_05385 [Clostridiales bacterium 43-6]